MKLLLLLIATLTLTAGGLPNRKLSPGLAASSDTAAVCRPGYATAYRKQHPVTATLRKTVFAAYGLVPDGKTYELDHVIPLEAGGATDAKNLFPQLWVYARSKDSLENLLHKEICAGRYPIKKGQHDIATNWRKLWLRIKPKGA